MKIALLVAALVVSILHPTSFSQEAKRKPDLSLKVEADFLALRITGAAPPGAAGLEYRFAEKGRVEERASWTPIAVPADGDFRFKIPLPASRWGEVQVRAVKDGMELAKKSARRKDEAFEWQKPERIAALPEAERAAWQAYMARSTERFEREYETLAAECRALSLPKARPAPDKSNVLEIDSDTPLTWFSSDEALKLVDAIISYQTPSGGWSKAVDYSKGPRQPGTHWTSQTGDQWHYCGTFDNRATTEQIKLLSGVATAAKRDDARAAALRGIEYLLDAQFPNGGWPQNYPVESGYHEAITLNDNAMVHVLEVLLAVAREKAIYAFVSPDMRKRAQAAVDKGIACLLAAQVKMNGQPTVWCAQHEPLTLEPAHARSKEPPSLSGAESAELLKFLMRDGPLTPEVKSAIEAGIAWLDANRITGLRKTKNAAGKTDYVADPASTEEYWARFYDLKTGKPIFPGSQDGVLYATFSEMAAKNKVAYDFLTTKPRDVIGKEVERWKKRMQKDK